MINNSRQSLYAKGGADLMDDDIYLATDKNVLKKEIKELQKRKESAGKMLEEEHLPFNSMLPKLAGKK